MRKQTGTAELKPIPPAPEFNFESQQFITQHSSLSQASSGNCEIPEMEYLNKEHEKLYSEDMSQFYCAASQMETPVDNAKHSLQFSSAGRPRKQLFQTVSSFPEIDESFYNINPSVSGIIEENDYALDKSELDNDDDAVVSPQNTRTYQLSQKTAFLKKSRNANLNLFSSQFKNQAPRTPYYNQGRRNVYLAIIFTILVITYFLKKLVSEIMHQKHLWESVFFTKAAGQVPAILLKMTLLILSRA